MTERPYKIEESYRELRDQTLRLSPHYVEESDFDEDSISAVVMETGFPEAVATLVCTVDGTTSLYISSGGGVLGAGEQKEVRKVSIELIELARNFLAESERTFEFPYPKRGHVRFYLITPGGVYTFEALEDDLGFERHIGSPLFLKTHELIAAIRNNTNQ